MKKLAVFLALPSGPALAASGPFLSFGNTDFVVIVSFLLFIAVLLKFGVPGLLAGMLDKRADGIRSNLDEARRLREEAQTLLASYERKHEEIKEQTARIIAHAKAEAEAAAEQAKEDLKRAIERRLQTAEDRIASAEAAAVRDVRDRAIAIATGAAGDVIARKMTPAEADALINDAIADVGARLH